MNYFFGAGFRLCGIFLLTFEEVGFHSGEVGFYGTLEGSVLFDYSVEFFGFDVGG